MKIFGLVILFILVFNLSEAQYYENGQDPFSINWKKIETQHFRIIFSSDIDSLGNIYASYFEKIYKSGGNTLGHNPRKIPVIIHNQNVISNGEVAWVPKRMNLYAVSPQFGYFESYHKNLALHEFRHVVQIDKLNQSSTCVLYFLFGEQAIGAVLGWHIPLWFFEGDAVVYETGASNGGRGRIPDFSMKLKAQIQKYDIYSYPKAQFGSYKSFVPNHYELGYQLISLSREKYGVDLWESTLNQVAKSPIHPNAFSKGIKKRTKLPERKFYFELMEDFKKEINKESIDIIEDITDRDYINYYSPHTIGDNILSYKTSFADIPRIVITNSKGVDKIVHTPGYIFNQTFSYNDSVLVWNEYKRTRWQNDNYNRIVLFDLSSNRKTYLTKKTRAFSSRISPDKSTVLSVEVDKKLGWSITFRDAFTGELIDSVKFINKQPLQPNWSPNMDEIVFMQLGDNGKSLGVMNIQTRKINWIIKDSYIDMSYPVHLGNTILIKGVFNQKSNYLKFDLNKKIWTAINDVSYGVGEAEFSDKDFVYTSYTGSGYKLKKESIKKLKISKIQEPERFETKLSRNNSDNESIVRFNEIDTIFQVENYSRLKHLLNVHSWAPIGISLQNIEVGPGATIMSQNALSTSTLMGGYQYNITDKSHKYYVDYSYKGFYPYLNSNFSTTYYEAYIKGEDDTTYFVKYSDISLYSSVLFPFNFDRGKWFRRFQPQFAYEYREIHPSQDNEVELSNPKIHSIYYRLYFYNLLTTSHRDLQPKWGQALNLNFMSSPFNTDQMGKLASAEIWLYFPGLFKNHGLKIYGGYQIKEYGSYGFTDRLDYPFGYQHYNNTQMLSAHVNYSLPLLYPDLNIWEFIYIKRLKANIFYQFSGFEYNNNQFDLESAGFDLTSDMHIFRFIFPFELGLRYARRLTYGDNYYQFLFNMKF